MISSVATRGQAAAQRLMTDTCVIARGAAPVFSEDTGTYTPASGTQIYAGPCRVRTENMAGSGEDRAGERLIVGVRFTVSIPITATGVTVDDVVTVTAADPELTGRSFRVGSVDHQSHGTARRLHVEEYQS